MFSVFSSCFIWSSSMSPLFIPKAKCVQQVKKDRTARKKHKTPTTTSRIPPMCIILKIAPFPQILSMAPCEKCEVKIEPPINVVMNEKKMRGQERHHILLFKTLFERSIFQIFCKVHLGSFRNYVDKMGWVGGQKMPIWVHVQGEKCPLGGR